MIMDLRRLRYFVATSEELHFGRAAKRLGMSQPPLSMQIRALERELGVTLFDRDRRNVALTVAGEVLLCETRRILAALDHAKLVTQRAAQGLHGALSVGFITPAEYSFLPRLVRTFRQQYPGVTLQLREAMTDTQIEELKRGALDVGLLSGTVDGPGFSCQVIWSEPLVAAIPRKHALAVRAAPFSVKRLAGEELVMFPREIAPVLFDEILGFCRSGGFSPRITQEARQTQTIISLVSAGLGIAITPASIRHLERKGVVYRTFRERTPIVRVSAVWSNDRPSQAVINFVAIAQSTAATLLVSARR
jgi:DNA-binding transcriptional LysR family regulator